MSESAAVSTPIARPVVQFAPSDIARRRIATWNGIQTDAVEVLRREPFEYGFTASRHLLIMCERGERDDGETLVVRAAEVDLARAQPEADLRPGRPPVLRLAEAAQADMRHLFLHRSARSTDRSRAAFRRKRVHATTLLLRPRLVGNRVQAQSASRESGARAEAICGGAERRVHARAAASQQRRWPRQAADSRRPRRLAREESGAIHRSAPFGGHLAC